MRKIRGLNITAKLALAFIVFAAILVASVSTLSFISGRAALKDATEAELLATAIEKESALNRWTEKREADVVALAASPDLVKTLRIFRDGEGDSQQAYAHLQGDLVSWVDSRTDYRTLEVIEPERGRVIVASSPADEGKFREDRPYFISGLKEPFIQNPYYSLTLQDITMAVSAPILADDGTVLGVLAARLNLQDVDSLIGQRTGLHQTDDAFLVNTANLFVTQPRFITDPAVLQRGVHTEAVERCLSGENGILLSNSYRGIPSIIVYRWLPDRELCLKVEIAQAEAFAPMRALGRTILLISGITLLAAVGVAIWLAHDITRPVNELAVGAQTVGGGDLSYRVPVQRQDELGRLAASFNEMAADLALSRQALQESRDQLEHRVQERTADLRRANEELQKEVSERRKAEAALRASEAELRAIFEAMPDAILVFDIEGRYVKIGPANQDLLLLPPDELVGKRLHELFPADEADFFLNYIRQALGAEQAIHVEYSLPINGQDVWFAGSVAPMTEDQVVWVARDVTGRKRAEAEIKELNEELEERVARRTSQLEAANRELEAFSYSVSHDLRAPLRGMDGFSRILLDDYASDVPSEAHSYLERIRANAQQMGELIDDLLAFSRLNRGDLNRELVDSEGLVRQVLADLENEQQGRSLEVKIDDLPACRADPALLRQVFANLLENALKYTRLRETAYVEVGAFEQEGETVYFVRDNGVGFDMKYADKLFGVFQRLHRAEDYEGTGVGLATVQRIVRRHGGRVWAEAEVEKGATFYFTLEGETDDGETSRDSAG